MGFLSDLPDCVLCAGTGLTAKTCPECGHESHTTTKSRYKALGALDAAPKNVEHSVVSGAKSRARIESHIYLDHAQNVRLAQHAQRVGRVER